MSNYNENFFSENINQINYLISRLLIAVNSVPLLLLIFTKVGLFSVKLEFSLLVLGYTVIAALSHLVLMLSRRFPKLTMYYGLSAVLVFITLIGTNAHIGVYITFGLVPIISCLYYDIKVSHLFLYASYFSMLISLYFKWKNGAPLFDIQNGADLARAYIPVASGFTIEFAFIFIVIDTISSRNNSTLRRLMSFANDRSEFVSQLRKSKSVLEVKTKELEETQSKLIKFVAEVLGSHDLLTGSHVVHTQKYVELIARKLCMSGYYQDELTERNIQMYANAAFLHDIGKVHIPEGILNKLGKFTIEEFEMMKSHPAEGKALLQFLPKIGDGKFNEIAIEMAYCHHEKWDGTGYPERKKGFEIPLCARIMAAADVLDALISKRYYKEPMSIDAAMRVFYESRGTHFEPCIADAVIELKNEIAEIDAEFKKNESEVYKEKLEWWQRYHKMKDSPKN